MSIQDDVPIIDAKGISKHFEYDGEKLNVLSNLDFVAHERQLTVIVGASGSGKTTLLSILGLLDEASCGEYFLDGKNVAVLQRSERDAVRMKYFGYLFQNDGLIERKTVLSNVSLPLLYKGVPLSQRTRLAQEELRKLGLSGKMLKTPNYLSGGERLRAGLARALICKPRVLICDEPTSSLNSELSLSIIERLKSIARNGTAVIIASHDPIVMERADCQYKIENEV